MNKMESKILDQSRINQEYDLIVKADQRDVWVKDVDGRGNPTQYQSKMSYLVPLVNTASTMFFDAWLPAYAYDEQQNIKHHEIAIRFPYPINRTVRCGVCRKNKNYPDSHHIVIMSSPMVEEILSKYIGKTFQVRVLADKDTEAALL